MKKESELRKPADPDVRTYVRMRKPMRDLSYAKVREALCKVSRRDSIV